MSRRIVVRCPITGTSFRVDQGEFNGRPEVTEDREERGFVPEELPSGWANLLFFVRVANPQAAEVRELRAQAMRGIDEQVRQQAEAARAAGQVVDNDALTRARNAMIAELDDEYPEPPATVCVRYEVLDISPAAVPGIVGSLATAGLQFVSPAEALGVAAPVPAPAPEAPVAVVAPAAPVAVPAPAPVAATGTPATGAALPSPEPPAADAPKRTPATGAAIPETAPVAPAAPATGTPATGAAIPPVEPKA